MVTTTSRLGNMSMLFYVTLTAFSAIFIHHTNQQFEPILAAFYTFLFCLIIYNVLTLNKFINLRELKKHFSLVCMLNITTMLCWILSFISLKYIPPDLYLFIYLCAMPITGSIIYKKKAAQAAGLLTGIVVLASTYPGPHLLLGFLLAFIGGACGTVYSIYSKKISTQFSTLTILSLRFYLTVLVTGIISLCSGQLHWMNVGFYAQFGLLSIIAVIVPLVLFQVGIKTLPITNALSFLPLAPLFCYLITHFIVRNSAVDTFQLLSVGLLSVAMML